MTLTRRELLQLGAVSAMLVAAGLLRSEPALAQQTWNKAAFSQKTMGDAVKAMGGADAPTESADIAITAPEIAENGAVVPVAVTSKIPGTQAVYIMVEKNPDTLSAAFTIPEGTNPTVSTRIKMGQTSNVYGVVKANDKFYYAAREVKVTLGGCGG